MVVVVNGNGPWASNEGDLPGLYARFINQAITTIKVGARGKVATIKAKGTTGTAEAGKVYRITKAREAEDLFGADNIEDIKYLFIGGASEVVVSVFDKAGTTIVSYADALGELETYDFHQYVGPVDADTDYATDFVTWITEMKTVTKNFIAFYADPTALDVAAIKAEITQFNKEENVVYVANGVLKADGTEVKSDLYAFYVAGRVAGLGLAEALTFATVPFVEPNIRFKNADEKELLAAGALITKIDGDSVQILQGRTIGAKPYHKIRIVRAKQAMLDDIDRTTKAVYIGKITNHEDGRIAVINGVKQYLTTLASSGVIHDNFAVGLDPDYVSTGDELYLLINVKFLDSIEYVKLTAVVRQTDEI